jgi:hypothetical protein
MKTFMPIAWAAAYGKSQSHSLDMNLWLKSSFCDFRFRNRKC